MASIVQLPTEILNLIALELSLDREDDPDKSFGNYRERNKIRRRHLARLAGTCRRLYDIVNPILWSRHWKEALLSAAEHGRHDIIDFLADNQATLGLEGLDEGANCFDHQFAEIDHWNTECDEYAHDVVFEGYTISCRDNLFDVEDDEECTYEVPLFPAILVPAMDASPNKDPTATIMHMINKGKANPYAISRNPCSCSQNSVMDNYWRSVFHTLLCTTSDLMRRENSPWKYAIVHHMLRDIKDFDLQQAYGDGNLVSWLICQSEPGNGAPEHLPDIIDLLATRYGMDMNQGFVNAASFEPLGPYLEHRPLHDAIMKMNRFDYDKNPHRWDYIIETISRLFHHGADPSLAMLLCGHQIRRYNVAYYKQWPVTAMGVFLFVWWQGRINAGGYLKRCWGDSWDWRPLAHILISNGARCHFDGNWDVKKTTGLYDFEFFMGALEGACEKRDTDMLKLVVDDLAPTLFPEGPFTPRLWEIWRRSRTGFTVPR